MDHLTDSLSVDEFATPHTETAIDQVVYVSNIGSTHGRIHCDLPHSWIGKKVHVKIVLGHS